jgi:hypothetical protein
MSKILWWRWLWIAAEQKFYDFYPNYVQECSFRFWGGGNVEGGFEVKI